MNLSLKIKDLNITKIRKSALHCRNHTRKCMVCRTPLSKSNSFLCGQRCYVKWYNGIVFIDTDWKIPLTNANSYFQDLYDLPQWRKV